MKKSVRRMLAQGIGISTSATLAAIGVIALRHALETPQPLKSRLPGESLLYVWHRRSIFYKVLGDINAPPLVLLHTPGIGASAHEMQQLIEPLAQTYRVYAPDLLGFGLSDRPGVEYSAALYTELCQDFLRDVVRQPATLVASGLSCNYAVSVADSTPELCSSLVLISPLALCSKPREQGFSFPIWQQKQELLKTYAEQPMVKALLYPLISTRLAFLLTRERRQNSQGDFAHFYAVTHQLGAEHAAMALLAGKLSANIAGQFETLRQPVLLIWGTQALENKRHIASLQNATQNRQARTVELIQNANLAVHLEQPVQVIAAIQRWQPAPTFQVPSQEEPLETNAIQPAAQAWTLARSIPVTPARLETFQKTPVDTSEDTDAEDLTSTSISTEISSGEEYTNIEEGETGTENAPLVAEIFTYCVKCKKKTAMQNASEFTMKNGRLAARGTCAICGTSTIRIGGLS